MKKYSNKRAVRGKTAYRTPSRFIFAKVKAVAQSKLIKMQNPHTKSRLRPPIGGRNGQ